MSRAPTPGHAAEAWATILATVERELAPGGVQCWLVGGCLRDALLGGAVHDLDLTITADPLPLARALATEGQGAVAPLRQKTVRVVLPPSAQGARHLDISRLEGTTIDDDLAQRDFRCNALALPFAAHAELLAALDAAPDDGHAALPSLYDPLDGMTDLRQRVLRVASRAAFLADAGRIVRGARFYAALGLVPSPETTALALAAMPSRAGLPADRVRDELSALLAQADVSRGLGWLAKVGALDLLLRDSATDATDATEVAPWQHLLRTFAMLTDLWPGSERREHSGAPRPWPAATYAWYAALATGGWPRLVALGWCALLHAPACAAAPPAPNQSEHSGGTARRLRLGGSFPSVAPALRTLEQARAVARAMPETRLSAARWLFERAGRDDSALDALVVAVGCALARAEEQGDPATRHEAERMAVGAGDVLARYFADPSALRPPPFITGADLIREGGIAPGRELGLLLGQVRRAQLDGSITTRAEALALALRTETDVSDSGGNAPPS